ncbi:hypothetical protein U752_02220 [Streptococcus pseudopneumoniae 1321]|nr:hypothetical protein U752_02220 [Streptococcus pseudopneumoniae 1321]
MLKSWKEMIVKQKSNPMSKWKKGNGNRKEEKR